MPSPMQMPPQGMARVPMMPPGYVPAAYSNYGAPASRAMPAPYQGYAPAPQAPAQSSAAQTIQMLRDSDFPSQREWAADQLAGLNWRNYPQAVQALLAGAKADPAPMVRACCVRSLMKMQVNTVPVVEAMRQLKSDPDPRVRDAVGEALVALGVEAAPASAPIRPVGH